MGADQSTQHALVSATEPTHSIPCIIVPPHCYRSFGVQFAYFALLLLPAACQGAARNDYEPKETSDGAGDSAQREGSAQGVRNSSYPEHTGDDRKYAAEPDEDEQKYEQSQSRQRQHTYNTDGSEPLSQHIQSHAQQSQDNSTAHTAHSDAVRKHTRDDAAGQTAAQAIASRPRSESSTATADASPNTTTTRTTARPSGLSKHNSNRRVLPRPANGRVDAEGVPRPSTRYYVDNEPIVVGRTLDADWSANELIGGLEETEQSAADKAAAAAAAADKNAASSPDNASSVASPAAASPTTGAEDGLQQQQSAPAKEATDKAAAPATTKVVSLQRKIAKNSTKRISSLSAAKQQQAVNASQQRTRSGKQCLVTLRLTAWALPACACMIMHSFVAYFVCTRFANACEFVCSFTAQR